MDLLSATQRLQIRGALQNVFDTFCKTPIEYHLKGESADRWQEDKDDEEDAVHTLMGFVEFRANETDEVDWKRDGLLDDAHLSVLLGLDDLIALGLINPTTNEPIFDVTRDEMKINGEWFRVIFKAIEGAFEQKNVMVKLYGQRMAKVS